MLLNVCQARGMPRRTSTAIVLRAPRARALSSPEAQAQIARLSARLHSVKARAAERTRAVQHTAVAAAAAAAVGALAASRAREGRALPSLAGLDPLLVYGAASWLAASFLPGRAAEIASAAADGLLSVYAYQLTQRG